MAELKRTAYGKVDLDYVLGIGGFDLERFGAIAPLPHFPIISGLLSLLILPPVITVIY